MDSTGEAAMTETTSDAGAHLSATDSGDEESSSTTAARQQVSDLFGGLRAEWLGPRLYDLYRGPQYMPELLTSKPCILVGGRGTGKTTVLRILSYEGQYALASASGDPDVTRWKSFGMYWRLDTNQLTAFQGHGVDEDEWTRVFGHYVNLILCRHLTALALWYRGQVSDAEMLDERACDLVSRSLRIESCTSLDELHRSIEGGLVDFEGRMNNIVDEGPGLLSMQASPVDVLVRHLRQLPQFSDRLLFFLLDEFENLLDYQQRVLNTFIKHSGTDYTFKIGVKLTGHRDRRTLNPHEALQEPADYTSVDISDRLIGIGFGSFARDVCDERLAKLAAAGVACPASILDALPSITELEEARHLGLEGHLHRLRRELVPLVSADDMTFFDSLEPLEAYLVRFWAEAQHTPVQSVLAEAKADRDGWRQRLGNYQHAMLFTIKEGKRGQRKLYAGWDSYLQLSKGNIRFLLQLVMEALLAQLDSGLAIDRPVSVETQTAAAIAVGRKNVSDLQGLDPRGGELSRLVLGLGRVFQVMAQSPEGHTPELNQFRVKPAVGALSSEARDLLEAGVRNLALIRFSGNKMAAVSGETHDWDYALHPVYSAFFGYSYRSKRRMTLPEQDLLGFVRDTHAAIEVTLRRQARTLTDLPDQMHFFEGFYGDSS